MISGTSCPVCGQQLPGPDPWRTGRKPRYCSNACKAKAYRDRQHSGEHASAAGPPLPSSAADRYARTIEIRQQISDLTTAMAETASGQQAMFASPRTPPRRNCGSTAPARHRTRGTRCGRARPDAPDARPPRNRDAAPVRRTGNRKLANANDPRLIGLLRPSHSESSNTRRRHYPRHPCRGRLARRPAAGR